ncbi:MAG: ribosome maturation factor RimP [Clostridiales bacterium]|nr:ribosome maturation factor RimP [Clostridiales bacterium]
MAKHDVYVKKTEKLLESILGENQIELYDIEYVKEGSNWYLRVFIDKEAGITIDDCELVSRALSDELDKADFIPDSYILEVSSPGLGRQLKKDKHFEKSIGEEVEIKLYKPIDKQKEWVGTLKSFDAQSLKITLEDGTDMDISRKDIALVRLTIDF